MGAQPAERLERALYTMNAANITAVWSEGRLVHTHEAKSVREHRTRIVAAGREISLHRKTGEPGDFSLLSGFALFFYPVENIVREVLKLLVLLAPLVVGFGAHVLRLALVERGDAAAYLRKIRRERCRSITSRSGDAPNAMISAISALPFPLWLYHTIFCRAPSIRFAVVFFCILCYAKCTVTAFPFLRKRFRFF